MDLPAIRFLQANLGLARFTTLGPITPNYGAYFGIASIDVDYVPVLKIWQDYLIKNLHPMYGVSTTPVDAIRTNLAAYQAVGVKFVVAERGADPFKGMNAPAKLAYADTVMEIYELASPASYVAVVHGSCALTVHGRTEIEADCDRPSSIIRRELLAPGWSAAVNGEPAPIQRGEEIFQTVALPAGRSVIQFDYAPPGIGYAYAACLLGVLSMGVAACRRQPHANA